MIKKYGACLVNIMAAHKKRIGGLIILAVLAGALVGGVQAMFRVSGVVTRVDHNSVSVADFLRTQTVDLSGSPVNVDNIKVGDRVKIQKNLQGQILYARTASGEDGEHGHERKHH